MVSGRLNVTLKIARVSIDRLKMTPELKVLASYVDEESGATRGWVDEAGIQWSKDTKQALDRLYACLAQDLARVHFESDSIVSPETTAEGGLNVPSGGLSEYLGDSSDGVPSV